MKTLKFVYLMACYIVGMPILIGMSIIGIALTILYNIMEDGEPGARIMIEAYISGLKEGHWRNMQWVKHGRDWTNYDWDEYPVEEY